MLRLSGTFGSRHASLFAMHSHAIAGAILGTAIGDAIGLPYEALSRRRAQRLLGVPDRHRFLFGCGMVSDDTEHTCLVAQALCRSGGDLELFRRDLARGMRWWLLGLPAGIGFATLRATIKLWLGFPPTKSGVFSAGNGPAMRVAVLGAAVSELDQLSSLVQAATLITHTDPKAYAGAMAVALAARQSARSAIDCTQLVEELKGISADPSFDECCGLLASAAQSVERGEATTVFAAQLGCDKGVSGYVFHTVPVAVHAWLSFPHDFARAVQTAVECGGDTDTVAAIVGGIVGAGSGCDGIPSSWLKGLIEWPRSVAWMQALARSIAMTLAARKPGKPPRSPTLVVLPRNVLFFVFVLVHIVRRALPPY